MLMDDNDIDENASDGNVSVHSIVTDKEEFDSDNESPQDQINQNDKVLLNHVVKRIDSPGRGVEKPSKFDFLQVNYTCYFQGEENKPLISNRRLDDYSFRILFPYGIVKAIKFMRRGEKATITLETKYGFRKVKYENMGRYIELGQLGSEYKENEQLETLHQKMLKTTMIYEVELIAFEKIYDLTGKRNLMKRVLIESKGMTRPHEESSIIYTIGIYHNNNRLLQKEKIDIPLSSPLLTQCEKTILKSMKKKEKCQVEILNSYFNDCINNTPKGLIAMALVELGIEADSLKGRIKYEVELNQLKNNKSIIELSNCSYNKTVLCKGIGNISPWKDSLAMLVIQLIINGEEVYNDLNKNKDSEQQNHYESFEAFTNHIKAIKSEVKQVKNYEMETQFLVDNYFKITAFPIYDELDYNLPSVFRKEIIQSMKPLSVVNLSFTIPNTTDSIEKNYFKLGDYDLIKEKDKDHKTIDISFNCSLINFEENVSVFNNKLIIDKYTKINTYKTIANDFYSKGLIKTAKKINKKLVDGYIKALNLGNEIVMNDDEQIPERINKDLFTSETHSLLKKIMSNLIMILFKMQRLPLCEKYISEYIQIYNNDEKVYYIKLKLHQQKGELEQAKATIDVLLSIAPNNEEYKHEKADIEKKIAQSIENHKNLLKRMMKSNNN